MGCVPNAHGVKYLVIGAYAVSIHAQPKTSIFWCRPMRRMRQQFSRPLARFGAPLEGLTPADFAQPGPFFRMGRERSASTFSQTIPGVDFDEAWPRRIEAVVDSATGLKASFISGEDLRAAKTRRGQTARPCGCRRDPQGSQELTVVSAASAAAPISSLAFDSVLCGSVPLW